MSHSIVHPSRKKELERIKRLWDSSKTLTELTKILKLSIQTVRSYQRILNLKCKKPKRINVDYIKSHWDSKLSLQELAKKFKVSYPLIVKFHLTYNLPVINFKQERLQRSLKKETCRYLLRRGFSYEDISRLFRLSRQRILQITQQL